MEQIKQIGYLGCGVVVLFHSRHFDYLRKTRPLIIRMHKLKEKPFLDSLETSEALDLDRIFEQIIKRLVILSKNNSLDNLVKTGTDSIKRKYVYLAFLTYICRLERRKKKLTDEVIFKIRRLSKKRSLDSKYPKELDKNNLLPVKQDIPVIELNYIERKEKKPNPIIYRHPLYIKKKRKVDKSKGKKNWSPKIKHSSRSSSKENYETGIIPGKQGNPITPSIIKRIESITKSICREVEKKKKSKKKS